MKNNWAWQASLLVITLLGSNFFLFNSIATAYNADTWRDAEQAYQKICSHCHNTGIGPVILGRKLPVSFVTLIVRHGNGAMPAFRQSDIDNKTLNELAVLIENSKPLDKLISSNIASE